MADAKDDEVVTFLNSAGEEISNDPRWHARRILGEQTNQADNEKDDIIARLKAQLAQMQAQGLAPKDDDDELDGSAGPEVDENGHRTYNDLKGADLLAEFNKREGLTVERKTAGNVRAALIADDAAKLAAEKNEGE